MAYINGAKAELSVKTIKNPSNSKTTKMGPSHHFFLILRKSHNSFSIDVLEYAIFNSSNL